MQPQKATSFVKGRSRNDLDSDEKLELAVIRLVEVIGEAAKNLSQEFKDKNPQIPWKQIMGTRDRLIHGYFDVDPDVIWTIVTRDLPYLTGELKKLLTQKEI